MSTPTDAGQFALQVREELRDIWRTPAFLTPAARHAVPVIGAAFLGWPALQLAIYFVFESWLMLSLYAAADLSFNPKNGGRAPRGWREAVIEQLPQFLAAAGLIAVMVGLFGGFLIVGAFAQDEWIEFLQTGWREPSFLLGLALLIATCLSEAARFAQRLATRTPAQAQLDDLRIASLFYRVVLLFMASGALGLTSQFAFAPMLFALALGIVLTFFEALPRSAAALLGQRTPR
jgi:hypothetical protein